MQQALDSAEVVILDRLAASLNEATDHPLLTWISENRGHAALLFEVDRKHPDIPIEVKEPLVDNSLGGVDHPLAAETVRNFLGMLIADPAGEPILNEVDTWLDPLLQAFGRASERLNAGEKPAAKIKTDKLMAAAHAFIDEDADDPVRASVRHETINILSEPSARGWNFRALSAATGLPLARLHMFGTRHDHLTQVAVDMVRGAQRLSKTTDRELALAIPGALFAAPPSLFEGLIEIFNLSNLNEITHRSGLDEARTHVDDSMPEGLLTVSTIAVLLAAFKNRDEDPKTWSNASHMATLYLDEMYN